MLRTARICLWLLLASAVSHAATLTNLFNTGVDINGATLTNNAVDPHWQIASGPGPGATLTNAYVPILDRTPVNWLPDNLSSRWISPVQIPISYNTAGEIRYRTSINLTGLDPVRSVLHLQVLSDSTVTAVLLNNQVTGITFTNGYSRWGMGDITSGFQSGTNTLELVVTNPAEPPGFRCELFATDTPSTLEAQQQGTNLLVHWPTNLSCYQLESTTNLADNLWETSATEPTNLNDRFETTISLTESARYFRLRRPSEPDPTPYVIKSLDGDTETIDFSCSGSLGCSASAMLAEQDNYLDASTSIDWARCSTNDPDMDYVWIVSFPPEMGGQTYTLPRISGRNSPILLLPANCLPALTPTTREWSFSLSMTSTVDPTLTKTVRFHFPYTGSSMTMQDYQNELNGN